MIFGDLLGLKFPDICLTGEEKPRKNFTQETYPDRGYIIIIIIINNNIVVVTTLTTCFA